MDIRITIPADMQDELQQRALDCGQDVAEYVERLIEKDLGAPMSLRDLYAPVRREIEQSEISEDELDGLIEKARAEAFEERKRKDGER